MVDLTDFTGAVKPVWLPPDGFMSPTEIQLEIIKSALEGRNKNQIYKHFEMIENQEQIKPMGFFSRKIITAQDQKSYESVLSWMHKNLPLPDHITDSDKPIGKLASVIEFGVLNGFTWPEAVAQLIPVEDGRFIIKGDIAKARMFALGRITSWRETSSGSVKGMDFKYTITGSRKLHGSTEVQFSQSYTIEEAIRAGLYHPNKKGRDSKYWREYPERMCYYRCLGFIARDYFGDVLRNMLLMEEYYDFKTSQGHREEVNGKSLDFSQSTKQEEENSSVASSIVDRTSDTKEEEKVPDISEGHHAWVYDPYTDGLRIVLKPVEGKLGDNEYTIGTAKTGDIEEGRELLKRRRTNPVKTEDAFPHNLPEQPDEQEKEKESNDHWYAGVEELKKGTEIVKFFEENAPEDFLNWMGKIPGRRTENRLKELLQVYVEDPNQVEAYFTKTYGPEHTKTEEKSPTAQEKEHKPGSTQELPQQPKEEAPKESENRLGIDWGEKDPESGQRPYNVLAKAIKTMHRHDTKLYMQFEDLYLEQYPNAKQDLDEFMVTADAEELDKMINQLT